MAYAIDTYFAESLKKYINPIQLAAPKIGTIGYSGTLNPLIISGLDLLNLIKDKLTKRYVNKLPKFTIDAMVSMLL